MKFNYFHYFNFFNYFKDMFIKKGKLSDITKFAKNWLL